MNLWKLLLFSVMPSPHRRVPLDPEWAISLEGLRMSVPDYWWPKYKTSNRNPGTIVGFDPEGEEEKYFLLETDEEPGYQIYGHSMLSGSGPF